MSVVPVALFDLDNTLFDRSGTYRRWAVRFVAATGLDAREVEWFCREDQDGFADRSAVWEAAKARFGLAAPVGDLLAAYRTGFLDCCEPDGAVHDALSALREAGWRIGVVTNGSMPQQADKAERLGLSPLVDALCVSEELGVEKPDRRIFEEAVRRCAAAAMPAPVEARWMVGDAPGPDIGGAQASGLRAAWLHRGRAWDRGDGPAPDLTVATVGEAVEEILGLP